MPEPTLSDRLRGIFIPATTNFDAVTGEVAPVSFRDNLRKWVREPIDGILLFGSNGEGTLLDEDEKARLTAFAREVVPAGLPLLAGVGADSTRATLRQARRVAEAGADAILVHPPPYYGAYLPPAAMVAHFREVADGSPLPTIIYHIPKYTKVTLEAGLIAELTRHPNVVGVKDSSGDIKRFADYTDACGRSCRLFVGNGALLYTALELGAAGAIIGLGLIAPRQCAEILQHVREGNGQRAGEVQNRIAPLHREIVARHGPVGLKAALELIGYAGGPPRPPLRPLPERERQAVARVMHEAGLLSGSGRVVIET
ncbi:MAG TPA: dihydrodipicolinate synthase family protein [Longimicrobiales bacterium]|nr:dihydrodipicolinate synthase family protein [Longimicrobiales bacterium]